MPKKFSMQRKMGESFSNKYGDASPSTTEEKYCDLLKTSLHSTLMTGQERERDCSRQDVSLGY